MNTHPAVAGAYSGACGAPPWHVRPACVSARLGWDRRSVLVRFADFADAAQIRGSSFTLSADDGQTWLDCTVAAYYPGAEEPTVVRVALPIRLDSDTLYRLRVWTAGHPEEWPLL